MIWQQQIVDADVDVKAEEADLIVSGLFLSCYAVAMAASAAIAAADVVADAAVIMDAILSGSSFCSAAVAAIMVFAAN